MVENIQDRSGVKVHGYRWVVLGVFMSINLTIQVLWICFAPVSSLAAERYGVSDMDIGVLAMVFMVVYIIAFLPASLIIDKFGFPDISLAMKTGRFYLCSTARRSMAFNGGPLGLSWTRPPSNSRRPHQT